MDNNNFQSIDEQKDFFEEIKDNIEDDGVTTTNIFVTELPDWDLEPLYETVKRRDKK